MAAVAVHNCWSGVLQLRCDLDHQRSDRLHYRYAFSTGVNFPDYPKDGNWTDSYVITTREFGPTIEYRHWRLCA